MKADIEEIKLKEGVGIEIVLIVSRPDMPHKSDYSRNEESVDSFNAEYEKTLHDIHSYNTLHLGKVELTQEDKEI